MIFPNLELESIVQVGDKTRLNAEKTFVSIDEANITLVEIEPEAGNGFIDVTSKLYLDWSFSTSGDKTVSLRVTTDGSPELITKTLVIISEVDDKLFSADSDLMPYEPNILNWVRSGRNSFLDVHRASQDRIIKYLDENGYWDQEGNPLTKDAIIDINEVNDWSKFMTLKLIFEGISNATDDIFHEKSLRYREAEFRARDRSVLRVDRNGDGEAEKDEEFDFKSIEILRE